MTQAQLPEQIETGTTCPLNQSRGGNSKRRWLIAALVALAAIAMLAAGIMSRVRAETNLRAVTKQMAVPSVSVVTPKQTAPSHASIELHDPIENTREEGGHEPGIL
jgi:hypothetical protein